MGGYGNRRINLSDSGHGGSLCCTAALVTGQDAVEAYKPESGYSLLSFITYPLQNRFREV